MTEAEMIYNLLWETNTETEEQRKQREKEVEIKRLEDSVRFSNIDGFFPTPPELVDRMIRELRIEPGDVILEPSAGMGSIAERVHAQYPDNTMFLVEINHTLAKLCKAKGFTCDNADFLESNYKPIGIDKIIMNPPFEKWMDIDHVIHAWETLKDGGRMVAIMGAGAIIGSTKKHQRFNEWLYQSGAITQKLPEGAFKSAFRQTGVQTYLVIAQK